MTDEEIDKMEAGRELDALIIEKVMGWKWFVIGSRPETGPPYRYLSNPDNWNPPPPQWDGESDMPIVRGEFPEYSTDIAAAWLVVEKLRKLGKWKQFAEAFERQSPWHWAALSTEVFCRNVCKAALKVVPQQNYHEITTGEVIPMKQRTG